ncbi:uncharacterized protein PG986_010090 [Apiospora aurea]|uniref:Uncharacterized protein n=1 Tax=Apiospora aurea TaxID=335848 RepID=A0ABR1Q9H8_9PEZI
MSEWQFLFRQPEQSNGSKRDAYESEPVPSSVTPTTEPSPDAQQAQQPVQTIPWRDLLAEAAERERLGLGLTKAALKEELERPEGPKFRWCVTVDMQQTGTYTSMYVFKNRPLTWMVRHFGEGDLTTAAKTTTYKVTQDPESRFPLTMLTQTRLSSPSYGEQPLYHNHSCVDPEDEAAGREVVVAHIQLGFYMPMDISFYWSGSIRPLTLHADEAPAQRANRLPIHSADDDVPDAREILGWGRTRCETTAAFGGIVPMVKAGMCDMARQAIVKYGGMKHLGIQESNRWGESARLAGSTS